ncbi:hypothetical protein ACFVT5_06040 [Streptomyces sp. NPDC058001]|uniref:DUF7848 domain-containing protein n=1 Tax=Streptomyces sp. NPDC058001 TaxID=3346300 RepID=UPI0036E2C229
MTRAVLRFVHHTIRQEPAHGATFEAFCAASGCEETSGLRDAQEGAQDWCLRHTGRTGHNLFRRVATDHARVTRDE